MGIVERIKAIELEMSRTQKNKATMSHLCRLKAQLAKLRAELLEGPKKAGSSTAEGFEVSKTGHARVALIGFPSVGKSTLLSTLTGTHSEQASYEFTTLTCIPGNLFIKGTKIQLLDLPGIIEGAAEGKGRGRQVISVAKSSDLVLMVLDASKEGIQNHRRILENELESVGIRLNQRPAHVIFKKKKAGGIKINTSGCNLTSLGDDPEETVRGILHEYKIHHCEVLFREDCTADQLIDIIQGDRKYVKCIYVLNKCDLLSIEEIDDLVRSKPHHTVISCNMNLNLDGLIEMIWEYLELVRIYTKKRGAPPDFTEPVVLTLGRYGCSVESVCLQLHKSLVDDFNFALVWGASVRHQPQRVGLSHLLNDEDVVQM